MPGGSWAPSDTIAIAREVSVPQHVLQISPASTSAQLTQVDDDGYLNRVPPGDNLQGRVLAGVIADQLGGASGKSVNVAARDDAYGRRLSGDFSSRSGPEEAGRSATSSSTSLTIRATTRRRTESRPETPTHSSSSTFRRTSRNSVRRSSAPATGVPRQNVRFRRPRFSGTARRSGPGRRQRHTRDHSGHPRSGFSPAQSFDGLFDRSPPRM